MPTAHRFHARYLQSLASRIFTAAGTPPHIAADVAEILVNANLTGHDSHGVLRIPRYLQAIEAGRIVPSAEPVVVKETATIMVVDGQGGFGHYTARWAMSRAIERARAVQVCCISLVRTGHIGRVGEYAEQAARAGCIGLITSGDVTPGDGDVVPFGGIRGILGPNPIAAGVPTGDDAPFVLDYATSVIAEGKIWIAHILGSTFRRASLSTNTAPSLSGRPISTTAASCCRSGTIRDTRWECWSPCWGA